MGGPFNGVNSRVASLLPTGRPKFCFMTAYDVGLLILRVVLGLTMAAHGYNKFFGGGRIPGTAGWFESIGMKPGTFHARVAATTEISAGVRCQRRTG